VTVRVLFFGQLREIAGVSEDQLTLPGAGSLTSVFDHYADRFPALRSLSSSIVLARNQEFAPRGTPVEEGDEVAFLPPVSGGADARDGAMVDGEFSHCIEDPAGHLFALTRKRIDVPGIARRILRGEDGALIQFEGVVRNNTKGRATRFLDYECYEAMAIRVLASLGRDIASRHAIGRIALVHRLGRMEIGDASVAVIVTAPHRRPAFEAALEGINQLKKTVPIWKKEYFADGEVWVEGEWDESLVASRTPGP
jgi:molybdopterin synthase catalytic subunit